MAKWSLKNDQNQNKAPDMPPELSNYYREEKRDRMWGAWVLGFATLVITIALGVGLFMGGKWLVSQFTEDGEVEQPATTQTEVATTDGVNDAGNTPGATKDDKTDGQAAGENDDQDEGVVSDEAAVSGNLPDTGPGDTLAIFLAAVLLGTFGHSLAAKRS